MVIGAPYACGKCGHTWRDEVHFRAEAIHIGVQQDEYGVTALKLYNCPTAGCGMTRAFPVEGYQPRMECA